jgi:hypothetical protein
MLMPMPSTCVKCDYDISGLPKENSCPECSWPIADSLFRDPNWLDAPASRNLASYFATFIVYQVLGLGFALAPIIAPFIPFAGAAWLGGLLICWGGMQPIWLFLSLRLRAQNIALSSAFLVFGSLIGSLAAVTSAAAWLTMLAFGDLTWCFVTAKLALFIAVPTSAIAQSQFIARLDRVLSNKPSKLVVLANALAVIASLAVAAAIFVFGIYTAIFLLFAAIPAFAIGAIRSLRVNRLLEAHARRVG